MLPAVALLLAALAQSPAPYVVVLGVAQDGGLPHAGCAREHCEKARRDPAHRRLVSSLAIVDPASGERWMIDATPDFGLQLDAIGGAAPDGIFLTHAHIGHYTGLMHLGREVMGARAVPVYAMPRMASFLRENGPWSQLVELGNIDVRAIEHGVAVRLNERISVTPFLVPHRDEFSETVGFEVRGPSASVIFIPDIDKWERWDRDIEDLIAAVDVAYLDGTFFADAEVPGRAMSEIPHPFISESIRRFASLPDRERAKVRFIHLNHTNPALDAESGARRAVTSAGMRIAEQGERVGL